MTTAWVDPNTDVISDTVGGGTDEVATEEIVVKGAEIAGVEAKTGELETGGGLPFVVRGIVTDIVLAEEPGTDPGVDFLMVPGVTTGAVPKSAGVEKFPFGTLYVMLSDGNGTGTDGIDADIDGVDAGLDVDGGLCGPTDGGPQSKLTLWMPTSHSDDSTWSGS